MIAAFKHLVYATREGIPVMSSGWTLRIGRRIISVKTWREPESWADADPSYFTPVSNTEQEPS